jgi:DNA-binding MarR family transcriptional regulator
MDSELERLGRVVKQAQHRQFRAIETALNAIGTTLVQWDALRAIGTQPRASAHELALATFQTDQAFSTLGARLATQDLIDRRNGAGRRIEHRLTAKGEKLLAAANIVADRVRSELYAPVPKSDRRELLRILNNFVAADG